jgi:hypothetical protein
MGVFQFEGESHTGHPGDYAKSSFDKPAAQSAVGQLPRCISDCKTRILHFEWITTACETKLALGVKCTPQGLRDHIPHRDSTLFHLPPSLRTERDKQGEGE